MTFGSQPYLSVIVPVGRAERSLSCCLQSLFNQTLPREFYEVLFVIDGVPLPVLPTYGGNFRAFSLEASSGRAAARNRALDVARGVVAISLDSDMVACPELLAIYFRAHTHHDDACIGVRKFALPYPGMDASTEAGFSAIHSGCFTREDYRDGFYRHTEFLRRAAEPFWAFSTCNCSYPLDLARRIGGFDENIRGWGLEDQEFGYRLWKTGALEFRHLSGAVAIHIEHERDKRTEACSWMANRDYCVRKHGPIFKDPRGHRMFPLLRV